MGATQSLGIDKQDLRFACEQPGRHEEAAEIVRKTGKALKLPLDSETGSTVVHILSARGSVEGLRSLLAAYLERRQAKRHRELTPKEQAQSLASGVNIPNYTGTTPLMLAARNGQVESLCFLLSCHADPTATDHKGLTAAHYAASMGHSRVLRILAAHSHAHRLCVDIANNQGFTPLHFAAWHRQQRAVRVLCEVGASLTARTHGDVASSSASIVCPATGAEVSCAVGSNPLHISAMMGHNAAVRTILMAYSERVAMAVYTHHPLPVDPRSEADLTGNVPYATALIFGNTQLLTSLNPNLAIEIYVTEQEARQQVRAAAASAVPKLQALAAQVLEEVLLKHLDDAEAVIAASKQHTLTPPQPSPSAPVHIAAPALKAASMRRTSSLRLAPSTSVSSFAAAAGSSSPFAAAAAVVPADGGPSGRPVFMRWSIENGGGDSPVPPPVAAAPTPRTSRVVSPTQLPQAQAQSPFSRLTVQLSLGASPSSTTIPSSKSTSALTVAAPVDMSTAAADASGAGPSRPAEATSFSGSSSQGERSSALRRSTSAALPAPVAPVAKVLQLLGLGRDAREAREARNTRDSQPAEAQLTSALAALREHRLRHGMTSTLGEAHLSPASSLRPSDDLVPFMLPGQNPTPQSGASLTMSGASLTSRDVLVPLPLPNGPPALTNRSLGNALSRVSPGPGPSGLLTRRSGTPMDRSLPLLGSLGLPRRRPSGMQTVAAYLADTSVLMSGTPLDPIGPDTGPESGNSYGSSAEADKPKDLGPITTAAAVAASSPVPMGASSPALGRLPSAAMSAAGLERQASQGVASPRVAIMPAGCGLVRVSSRLRTAAQDRSGRGTSSPHPTITLPIPSPTAATSLSAHVSSAHLNNTSASNMAFRGTDIAAVDTNSDGGAVSAQGKVGSSDSWDNTCGVCMDVGDFVAIHGCHHQLCVECARDLVRIHAGNTALCPFCRRAIGGFTATCASTHAHAA